MTVPSSVFKAPNKVVVPGLASSLTFNAPAGSHIRTSLALGRLIAETVPIVMLFARHYTSRVLRKAYKAKMRRCSQHPGSENWLLSFSFSPYKSSQTSFSPLLKGEGDAIAPGEVWERQE
jgi:hypothetical protein